MNAVGDLLNNFKTALAADKKKTALMCGLLAVLLVVVGRLAFSGRTPKSAKATSPVVVAPSARAAQAGARVRPVAAKIASHAPNRRAAVGSAKVQPRRGDRASGVPEKVVSIDGLPRTLSRNIFDTRAWHSFTPAPSTSGSGTGDEGKNKPRGLFGGLIEELVAYQQSHRQEEKRIDDELSRLKLESTVTGRVPLACISGRLVREGDQLKGFSVLRIMDRRVMLRKSGITRVLNMP